MENNEKFNKVLEYFSDLNIVLPTDVRNAIEDVFSENDDVEEVECYHVEDLEEFQKDVSPNNNVIMSLLGTSNGEICNVWTYYGGLDYALTEKILLVDKNGEELETISEMTPDPDLPYSLVINPGSYQVVLFERVKWDSTKDEFGRHTHLYIYCPISAEGMDSVDEQENSKYNEIYNQIMMGGTDNGEQ